MRPNMPDAKSSGPEGGTRKRAAADTRKTLCLSAPLHAKLKAVSAMSGKSMESIAAEILERSLKEAWQGLLRDAK